MIQRRNPFYSVIIPALNEEENIVGVIHSVVHELKEAQIIVVDGGSRDKTPELAEKEGVQVIRTTPGRGHQCTEGAKSAKGAVLIFLHADTLFPRGARDLIDHHFIKMKRTAALFRLRFDKSHPILWFYSLCTRIDSPFFSFGDRCIMLCRDFYFSLGGFPQWFLYEDVELLRKVRKKTRIRVLPAEVITSSRLFKEKGYVIRTIKNIFLFIRYLSGTSSTRLYNQYYRKSFRK